MATKKAQTKSTKQMRATSTRKAGATSATKSTTAKSASTKKTQAEPAAWSKIWRILLCILVPLGGGIIISLFSRDSMVQFNAMKQPPLAPPAWLFPVAWTILYILMGVASYLIYRAFTKTRNSKVQNNARIAMILYGVQLVLNFIWTPLFFNANLYWVAFAVLLLMWILEIILLVKTFRLSRAAFWCLFPYALWTTFAAYLNISIAILN